MRNSYFEFKQFRIDQDKCTMKVCTDACIFGSWIAKKVVSCRLSVNRVLDIGSGTGLLSLMYAQKDLQAKIDAVEIDEKAFIQTIENFKNSKWNERFKTFHGDIKEFVSENKYDLVISNPPFYENDLLSEQKNKNIAKHNTALSLNDLILVIKNNIKKDGHFAIILPYPRINFFEDLAEKNHFFLREKLLIRQTPKHNFFRGILLFSDIKRSRIIREFIIKNQTGNYTDEFVGLLKGYYSQL